MTETTKRRKALLAQGLTDREIAEAEGVSARAAHQWRVRHGLPRNPDRIGRQSKAIPAGAALDSLLADFLGATSQAETAEALGVNSCTHSARLRADTVKPLLKAIQQLGGYVIVELGGRAVVLPAIGGDE